MDQSDGAKLGEVGIVSIRRDAGKYSLSMVLIAERHERTEPSEALRRLNDTLPELLQYR